MASQSAHLIKAHRLWQSLKESLSAGSCELDGKNLKISDVEAIARHGCKAPFCQDPHVNQGLQDSVDVLFDHLAKGWYVYGVNTGFGGSADSRTNEIVKLQAALMQLTQSGILSPAPNGTIPGHSMPSDWTRAAMVVRCNHTLRGHSAVSLPIVHAVSGLLEHGLTPVVPLRGSVSASGDLMPLAYVAGSIEGNPDILLEKEGKCMPAQLALKQHGLASVRLGPKEGLGLVNGTSSSAGLGALVMADAHRLALLTQVLTGCAVEALAGSSESFHPFIATSRPHPGQIECASNIHYFLRGSHLSRDVLAPKNRRREDMEQDRYSLRSAPQWIGPQLEDLILADQQITIELNSSCDNPLVDRSTNEIFYGCNFQAASVTSAMEKVRLSLQMFGRILFAQSTEMIDPTLSGGLPTNLAADDPSLSFTMKGVDINMAAYMAELSYFANPMSSHVQAAEMHNQSINSMALASARMSMEALDILAKMSAASIVVCCQALDLRALHSLFISKAIGAIKSITSSLLTSLEPERMKTLQDLLETHVRPAWNSTGKLDLHIRCAKLVDAALPQVATLCSQLTIAAVLGWKEATTKELCDLWDETFVSFAAKPHTAELLGKGSRSLYLFVRQELGVPFHQGFVEHPTSDDCQLNGRVKKTTGGWISVVHDALKSGALYDAIMPMVEEGLIGSTNGQNGTHDARVSNGVNGEGTLHGLNGYSAIGNSHYR